MRAPVRQMPRDANTSPTIRVPCDCSSRSQLLPSVADGTAGTLQYRRFHLLVNEPCHVSRQKPQRIRVCSLRYMRAVFVIFIKNTLALTAVASICSVFTHQAPPWKTIRSKLHGDPPLPPMELVQAKGAFALRNSLCRGREDLYKIAIVQSISP